MCAGKGESKQSLLLCSGWWGLARHVHYVPEILGAVCWTLPAGFSNALPWFYAFPFLTTLLVDRSFRDRTRCKAKYGEYWDEYCRRVPYNMIPFVW
jgi:7-dehydrocholesterol reductase